MAEVENIDNNETYGEELVSIITPAYNCANNIADTIDAVLNQIYTDWEMIIVDDCSSDHTVDIVKQYQLRDLRIKLFELDRNQGVANARNIAMQNAKGRYLAFLDSDDIWLPNKLSEQIKFMKQQNIAFSFTQYRQFAKDVNKCKKIIDVPESVDYNMLLKGNIIACLTVVIDRKYIPAFVMLKERHEDYIAWLHIMRKGFSGHGLKKDLARYRISSSSVSGNKWNSILWTWNIYYKIEKLSLIKSVYFFINYLIRAIKKHFF